MTNSSLPDLRTLTSAEQRREGSRGRRPCLPSAQVLTELAALGPELGRLAADLHERLSEPSDDRGDLASQPA